MGSTIAMAKVANRVMKKYAEDSELLALVTDAIALAIQCHHEAGHARRLAMKEELHKDYGSVCGMIVGTSEFLFGDLSKLTKDITDANKLTKKMRPPPPALIDRMQRHVQGSLSPHAWMLRYPGRQQVSSLPLPWLQKFEIFRAQPARIPSSRKRKGARSHNAIDT